MKTKLVPICYFFILSIIFLYSSILYSQDNSAKKNSVRSFENTLTLQHTTVVVSDFSKSKTFYTEVLKLKEIKTDFLPENQMFISLGDNLELHVGEVPGVEIKPSNFNHFALASSNFDEFLEYLKNSGIVYTNIGGGENYYVQKRPDGVRQTWIQDPDGYWIEINDAVD